MYFYSKVKGLEKLKGITVEEYLEKYPDAIRVLFPTIVELNGWMDRGICLCPDGCQVEPDGDCPHGYPSWLKILSFI